MTRSGSGIQIRAAKLASIRIDRGLFADRRWVALPLAAALLLAACPGLAELDVKIAAPREAGQPFVLAARVTLRDLLHLAPSETPRDGFSGRAQLGVRTPTGWQVEGRYRIGDATYELMRAAMVMKAYEEKLPLAGTAWQGFVSHLHTALAPQTPIEITVLVTPPEGAQRVAIEIAIGTGPAPHYPQWKRALAGRVIRLSF